MKDLNRGQIIKDLERLVDKYGENGSYNTYCTLSDTLALIKELTEENARLNDTVNVIAKEMLEEGEMTDEREMLDCCRDCPYQCTQYDDLTEFCGCDVADMEFFGRTEPKPECPWEESEDTE